MPIRSITLDSVSSSTSTGFATDCRFTGFDDGYIDGTSGNDAINGSQVAAISGDADKVDTADAGLTGSSGNDDYIPAGAGNDSVVSGLGKGVFHGGDGNGLLYGGYGADTIFAGLGNDDMVVTMDHQTDTCYGGEETGDQDNPEVANWVGTSGVSVTIAGSDAGTHAGGGADRATGAFYGIKNITGTGYADAIKAANDTEGDREPDRFCPCRLVRWAGPTMQVRRTVDGAVQLFAPPGLC